MPLPPGFKLQDYEIRRQLGAGGMGEVYLAHDVKLGRSVAIKVLSAEVASDHARIGRFEQEARAASALSHPNVCVVYALGETADRDPFIAMEYIDGHTLRHLLQKEPPNLKAALDIAIQIGAGAGAAHAIGIVHRDLKPENVIVRQDGLVKVLDFGLAKLTADGSAADESHATRTLVKTDAGVVMGTFTYMAPEQVRGHEVDARADIWALGVILYELVSSRPPFTGETHSDVMAAILEREPAPLGKLNPAIPHELQRIVAKALRKDRAQRYQTITDLRLDLEALRSELQASSQDGASAMSAPPASAVTPQPVRRESSAEYVLTGLARHKVAAVSALLVIAALAAGGAWRARRGTSEGATAAAPIVQRNLTRLTFGSGLQTDPTLSPDGRFLAYASDRAGNFDIWVQPVAGGDPVQITRDPEPETQPAWSPDGSTIVFHSEKGGGGLFVVPALGGLARRLTTFGERPVWSRDGSEVMFQVGPALNNGGGQLSAFSISASGGTPQKLAASVLDHGRWKWIAQHPDGRLSAFGTHETEGNGFFTFSRSGEHLIKSDTAAIPELISPNGFDRFRFVWNRAGTRIYVEATVKVDNLWRVDVDPSTLAWRGAVRLTTGGSSDVNAVLSADESRIAYAQQTSSTRLWSIPLDVASGQLKGQGQPFSEEAGLISTGDLLPDGSAAVYSIARPGADTAEIWVHRFDPQSSQFLVGSGLHPRWASDGRSIVYVVWQRDDKSTLMLREPDGTDRQLSPWSSSYHLLPSRALPGAPSVLVTALNFEGIAPLWVWSLKGLSEQPEKVLADHPHTSYWQEQISPNGRWLICVPQTLGSIAPPKIVVARADVAPVTEWTDVTPSLTNADKPRWSPDGRAIYFLTNRGGFLNLAAIRFDPDKGVPIGQPFDVTHFSSPNLVVSPMLDRTEIGVGAHRAMLTMVSSTGGIWMLDNVDK